MKPGLREALGGFLEPLPMAYSAAEWELLRQCFVVLRRAAAELQVVFTESGRVDYTEVAQIALDVLQAPDGSPSDFAMQFAGGIRHLLVDEFQDTSRKQFELIDRIVAAWPEREGRSCFCVGDPMQSIYGFRESEVELFERPARRGFAAEAGPFPDAEPLMLERVKLLANFRTEPTLVRDLNERFAAVFSESSSRQTSAVNFTAAVPALASKGAVSAQLHVAFSRTRKKGKTGTADTEQVSGQQMEQIVALIREHARRAEEYRQATEIVDAKKYRIAVLARKRKTLERIAAALDEAGIAYRATALVPLGERMEILDALSLARAALDPLDRTAWLSVLRGPWCGLTLSELYRLTSADDGAVKAKSVPELIAERLTELAASGFDASRVTAIEQTAEAIRIAAVQSSASSGPGTWLFDLWRTVGGERATNAVEKENLRLLWASLDALPNGEMDLLDRNEDSGLRVALDKLTAVPNPAASADFGVQLMTIHAAKGLEFEVVMVPELEAANRQTEQRMLAWLERGVEDAETPHLTEFLIAPIQRKGEEKGSAKAWVEGVMQERETDEMRRLLYVAATRAREELHLFTRAEYSVSEKDGARVKTPGRSLLASAWPGFAAEIEAAFTAFVAANEAEQASVAQAPAETNTSSEQAIPVFSLRRLKASTRAVEEKRRRGGTRLDVAPEAPLYRRSEGGLRVRVEGIAAHRLLQRLSWLRLRMDAHQAVAALSVAVPGLVAEMRSQGLSLAEAREIADWALAVAQRAGSDPTGAWIVAPHRQATSEAAWTGLITMPDGEEQLKTLRPDRCFLAGVEPLQPEEQSETTWWIIDYKTSGGELASGSEEQVATFVAEHKARFAGQLEAYAGLLRKLVAGDGVAPPSIRLGLYYPRLLRLDYWRG
uniref:DNA 3'-5' helicase n=1 Tax=mine drainage metagenome TaxID=410659 RepID=E6PZA3_9ZZZZ